MCKFMVVCDDCGEEFDYDTEFGKLEKHWRTCPHIHPHVGKMKETVIKIEDGNAIDLEWGPTTWTRFMGPCVVTIVEGEEE